MAGLGRLSRGLSVTVMNSRQCLVLVTSPPTQSHRAGLHRSHREVVASKGAPVRHVTAEFNVLLPCGMDEVVTVKFHILLSTCILSVHIVPKTILCTPEVHSCKLHNFPFSDKLLLLWLLICSFRMQLIELRPYSSSLSSS